MENVVKRQVAAREGMQAFDFVLVGVLLAVGMVLRMYMPPIGPITPNLVIGMYCLAIFLVRPRIIEAVVISIVAAALCQITSKSAVPYLNFISEPVGVLVALALVKAPFRLEIAKNYSFKPAVVTFLGTIASGVTYITIMKAILLFNGAASKKAFTVMLLTVLFTALANTVIVQAVYYPIKAALGKKD